MFGLETTFEIVVIAIAFSLANTGITRAMGIRRRMNEIQAEFKEYQKQITDATKAKDEKKLEKLSKDTERVNKLMMEMSVMPWKTMIFTLPLFFAFTGDPWFTHYAGLVPTSYPGFAITLPFNLHTDAVFALRILEQSVYGPRGFFVVAVLFAGIIVSVLEQNWDKRKEAKKR